MVKLEKIIRVCAIGVLGVAMYTTSLAAGYTVAIHYRTKALNSFFESGEFAKLRDNKGYEKCLEQSIEYGKKSVKWEKLTESVDLFHKLGLYR